MGSLLCISETLQVYPTATRALGLGTSSGMARVGALITPFVAQVTLCFPMTTQHKNVRVLVSHIVIVHGLHPAGDAGVLGVPGSVSVLLLLPLRGHRLLRAAN